MADEVSGGQQQESFSGLLLRYRGRTRLTQRQLADRMKVSLRALQRWETGVMYPGTERLQALLVSLLEERPSAYTAGRYWTAGNFHIRWSRAYQRRSNVVFSTMRTGGTASSTCYPRTSSSPRLQWKPGTR